MTQPPRLFRLLLRALPGTFRRQYADDMAATFVERLTVARRTGGRLAAARLWVRTSADLVRAGLAERLNSSIQSPERGDHAPGLAAGRRGGVMKGMLQDLRFAVRMLSRQRAYAFFVVLTLVVGLGANVTVFSVVNGVLLAPLPYPAADRLVGVWGRFLPESGFDFPQFALSPPELVDYARDTRALESVGGFAFATATITGPGRVPERVPGSVVTASFFDVLGMPPVLGRVFTAEETLPGGPAVMVLSHGFWQTEFGGGPDVVGQTIDVNGIPRTIIGVMPEAFDFPAGARLWTPLRIDPADPGNRQSHGTNAIGRLAAGTSIEDAHAEMATMMDRWKAEWPDIHTGHFLYLTPLLDDMVGSVRPILGTLFAATGVLLLIVCANVGSMLLARGESRTREMAIRSALGAARYRLLRLTLVESLMLAVIGCVGGLAVALAGVRWLRVAEGAGIPRLDNVAIDWHVMAFATGLSLLAAACFGIVPALRGAATRVQAVLRQDARTSTGRAGARRALVAAEVALTVVLVVGAGLMVRSVSLLGGVDPGFNPDRVLIGHVTLPSATYEEAAAVQAFYEQVVDRLAAVPGVEAVAAASTVPIVRSTGVWDFELDGRPEPGPGQPAWNAAIGAVTPGYFTALDTPVVRGRAFTAADDAIGAQVAVVTEAFARQFLEGRDPIGQRLRVAGLDDQQWATIVGVVGDLRDQSLDVEPRAMYFFPHAQMPRSAGGPARGMGLVIRTEGDPNDTASALRSIVEGLDASLPVYSVSSYLDALGDSIARQRFASTLFNWFAIIGLVLGAIGIYGVLAYTVAERTREIGIRRALGASGPGLVKLVLVQGMAPAIAGVVAGLALAVAGSRYLESELFGVSSTDPTTYVAVTVVVATVALTACLAPVRRALGVDPTTALRA